MATDHQIGVFEGACNECSNCETYCPEEGAPFRVKERVFATRDRYFASPADGFFRDGDVLLGRIHGEDFRLVVDPEKNWAQVSAPGLALEVDWATLVVVESRPNDTGFPFDTAILWRMKAVWDSVYHGVRPNPMEIGRAHV